MRSLSVIVLGLAVLAVSQTVALSQTINPVVFPCGAMTPVEPYPPHKPEFTECSDSGDRQTRCLGRLRKVQERYQEKLHEYQADLAQYKEKLAAYEKCRAKEKSDNEASRQESQRKLADDKARRNEFERQIAPAVQAVVDKFSARGQLQLQSNYSSFWLVATKSDDMRGDLQTICGTIARYDYVSKYRQYNPTGPKVRAVINVGSLLGPRQEINCE